jgi:hypothetical protein
MGRRHLLVAGLWTIGCGPWPRIVVELDVTRAAEKQLLVQQLIDAVGLLVCQEVDDTQPHRPVVWPTRDLERHNVAVFRQLGS